MKKKSIYYLIIGITLCGITLLLYYCRNDNPILENNSSTNSPNTTQIDAPTKINENITLTTDEKQKFSALKSAFDAIITNKQNLIKTHKNMTELSQDEVENYKIIISKYSGFIEWLANNPQKKKELTDAFSNVYNFLDDQRILLQSKYYTNNLTTEQLVINTINCLLQSLPQSSDCNNKDYVYNNTHDNSLKERVYLFFNSFLEKIDNTNTNENVFENMKDILLNPNEYLNSFIQAFDYEKKLKEKLSVKQKHGLDYLKSTLNNDRYILYSFLTSNEDKIKEVLDHINNELSKCSEDDEKKGTFKNAIKNYFSSNVINDQKLDEFIDKVKIGC